MTTFLLTSAACSRDASPLAPSSVSPAATSPVNTATATFEVRGTITSSADGSIVSGARVETVGGPVAPSAVSTDSAGRYALTDLVAGTYELRVTRDGFEPQTLSVLVTSHRTQDVKLTPRASNTPGQPEPVAGWTLSGRIVGSTSQAAVAGAHVIVDGAGRRVETWSDAQGRYDVRVPGTGRVNVRVEAEGFAAHVCDVSGERDTTLDVTLTPMTSAEPSGPPVAGRAINVLTGGALAAVSVRIDGGGEGQTGADGAFAVAGPTAGAARVTLSSASTVERRTHVQGGDSPTLSLIPRAFNLAAFDQMARSRGNLLRWVTAPRLVVERRVLAFANTTDSAYTATGSMMSEAEAAELVADLAWALPQLTGGTFSAFASVVVRASEESASVSITRPGEIVVARFQGLGNALSAWGYGRWAWNGAGEVQAGAIMLDDDFERSGSSYRRSLRAHELGHALGYDHVTATASVMDRSATIEPTKFDRDATTIAFRRSPLNASPDVDPDAATLSRRAPSGLQWDGRQ